MFDFSVKLVELKNQIFVGVVEDNEDPTKIGRIKVRVMNVYEDIPKEDLPWATPWKDLNGHMFILPEVGKVVSVVFDDGKCFYRFTAACYFQYICAGCETIHGDHCQLVIYSLRNDGPSDWIQQMKTKILKILIFNFQIDEGLCRIGKYCHRQVDVFSFVNTGREEKFIRLLHALIG